MILHRATFKLGAIVSSGISGGFYVLTVDCIDMATKSVLKRGEHRWEVCLCNDWVGTLAGENGIRHTGHDSIYFPAEMIDWLISELQRIKAESEQASHKVASDK